MNHLRTWIRRQDPSLDFDRRLVIRSTINHQRRVMGNDAFRVLEHFGTGPRISNYICKFGLLEIPEHSRAVP